MAYRFPSAEWTAAYKDAVNANEAYAQAGRDWNHGPVAFVIEAEPAAGIAQDVGMILDVEGGVCRETTYVEDRSAVEDCPFVIVGSYENWRTVLDGQLDPTKAMMQNRLKLTKGHLPTMLRFVESSKQLVASATRVPTEYAGG
jgi:putative sterol carrier protein